MEILCSTGALIGKPNNRDYRLLKELAGKLSCEKHIGEALSKGSEFDISEAFRRFEINCEMAEAIKSGRS